MNKRGEENAHHNPPTVKRLHNAQQSRRPSKGGDELQHQNKGQGVSCWAARPLAYPPPLDGSL